MRRSRRFYVFSSSSLDFREVRFFRSKIFGSGLLVGLLVIGLLLVVNHFTGDWLGVGFDRLERLSAENRTLRDQIETLSQRMSTVQKSLDRLHMRGNELRLLADLEKIDEDTRSASVGGANLASSNAFLTGEAGRVLTAAQSMIDKLLREVRLQQSSYDEIARQHDRNKEYFAHMPAIKPMHGYYTLNGFGMRIHPVLGVYRMHEGADIINDVGTPVYAAADGVVRFAGRTQGGYGQVVEISHGYGFTTLYAHLSKSLVQPGRTVKRGELIALSGRSGLVSGPHLHYEVRRHGAMQNPVDYFFDDVDAARYRVQLAQAR